MAAPNGEASDHQVLVSFTTKLPQELKVPETAMAVPAKLKRLGLSQIINHLLGKGGFLLAAVPVNCSGTCTSPDPCPLTDPPQPFDFLIDGELLRTSLQRHLLDHSISPVRGALEYNVCEKASCNYSLVLYNGVMQLDT